MDWFLKASNHTNFHEKLAEHLRSYLRQEDTVCDFGCGLGRLDLALAPYVKHITCQDIAPEAIAILKTDGETIPNLTAKCVDCQTTQEKFDVGIMSFFGKRDEEFLHYMGRCNRCLIRIVNMQNRSTLYPAEHRQRVKSTAEDVKYQLDNANVAYVFSRMQLEFGQPCQDITEASAFVRSHAPGASQEEIHQFIAAYGQSVEQGGYYIPNQKDLGIFIIDCSAMVQKGETE